MPENDLEQFAALYAPEPLPGFSTVFSLPWKTSEWVQTAEEIVKHVAFQRSDDWRQNLYLSHGIGRARGDKKSRLTNETVSGLIGFPMDVDIGKDGHRDNGKNYCETVEQALELIPPELPATCVVHTGHGIQPWHFLKEPYVFEDEADRQWAMQTFEMWVRGYQVRASGIEGRTRVELDDTISLDRVWRIPGTANRKPPEALVRFFRLESWRYNITELRDYLDERGLESFCRANRNVEEWRRKIQITVNRSARLPESLIAELCQHSEFRAIWEFKRGFKSQSEYDYALIRQGIEAGWNDQLIADATIHLRSRRPDIRKEKDFQYFQRSIAKMRAQFLEIPAAIAQRAAALPLSPCMEENIPAPPLAVSPSIEERAPVPEAAGPRKIHAIARAGKKKVVSIGNKVNERGQLIETLRNLLSLPLLKLIKFPGDSPRWILKTEIGDIVFKQVDGLISARQFRAACVKCLDVAPGVIKETDWVTKVLPQICRLVEITEMHDEEEDEQSQFRYHLDLYLEKTTFVRTLEDLTARDDTFLINDDFQICISGPRFRDFILRARKKEQEPISTRVEMQALGARNQLVEFGGKKNRLRRKLYVLPFEFDGRTLIQEYEEKIKSTKGGEEFRGPAIN